MDRVHLTGMLTVLPVTAGQPCCGHYMASQKPHRGSRLPGQLAGAEKLTHRLFGRAPLSVASFPGDQAAKQLPGDTLGPEHRGFPGC